MSSVSVVTNALRLRKFRCPERPQDILHPHLRERVGEYAYLVGIGILALAIGMVALRYTANTQVGLVLHPPSPVVPDRIINLDTTDQLRFLPDALTVKTGETVAFRISNPGAVPHEFVIGDAALQQRHEQEMSAARFGGMNDDVSYAVDVPAGKMATLVYTFKAPGTLLFGCHVAGHYAAGMSGTITITQ